MIPVPLDILSPSEMVDVLNEEGCDITLEQYRSLILALTRIGVKRVTQEVDLKLPGRAVGRGLQVVETIVDRAEHYLRKQLCATFDRHLNLTRAANRWFEDSPV